jgi:hypothetical protein
MLAICAWFASAHPVSKTCANRDGATASIKTVDGKTTIACANKRFVTIKNSGNRVIACAAVKKICAVGLSSHDQESVEASSTHISTKVNFESNRRSLRRNSVELECSDPSNGRMMTMQFHGEGLLKAPSGKELQPMCTQFLSALGALTSDSTTDNSEPKMQSDEDTMSVQPISVAEPLTSTPEPDEDFATLHPSNSNSYSISTNTRSSDAGCRNCRPGVVVMVRAH